MLPSIGLFEDARLAMTKLDLAMRPSLYSINVEYTINCTVL
jgi:hypothetical protein